MSNKLSKKQAEEEFKALDIALDRFKKLSEIVPDPDYRDDINNYMDKIQKIVNKYL